MRATYSISHEKAIAIAGVTVPVFLFSIAILSDPSGSMLSIETTTKLLKLHLQWPDRENFGDRTAQPEAFWQWLFIHHHDKPEVMEVEDVDRMQQFLEKNRHVLWPSAEDEAKWVNLRLEPRIADVVNLELAVVECDELELIGTSAYCRTLDLGLHGMRLTINEHLPAGTVVQVKVTPSVASDRVYRLDAEIRWSSRLDDGYLIGVKLRENKQFRDWQQNFGSDFVEPAMNKTKRQQV